MADNQTLHGARREKQDEFYTQLTDIENELRHYKQHFAGKTVYCNCDDPYESNFFKYFAANFNALGLKRLLATSFAGSPIAGEQLSLDDMSGLSAPREREAYKIDIRKVSDLDGDGAVGLSDVEFLLKNDTNVSSVLEGDGDFLSQECIALLQQADIIVTNPPFSLFRAYVAQLIKYNKRFLVIANKNSITYKEVYPLIQAGEIWVGYTPMGKDMLFDVPDYLAKELLATGKEGSKYKIVEGTLRARSPSTWLTNLDHDKRHEWLNLADKYSPAMYPKYDNYDAINVSYVDEIPSDYDGMMGVPISFLDKHNPDQFEIVRFRHGDDGRDLSVDGKSKYFRIIIRRKEEISGN